MQSKSANYWGDRVALWIWTVSFFAMVALIAIETLYRQIHSLLR